MAFSRVSTGDSVIPSSCEMKYEPVKSWLTSSVEDRESFSSRDDMGCTEHSSSCSTEIDDLLYLRRLFQGVSRRS